MEKYSKARDFFEEVWSIVRQIPRGKVLSYGDIARLMGRPRNSRMVGTAMWNAPADSLIPCHRVVSSAGKIAPNCPEHRILLEQEGVCFRGNGNVDMRKTRWEIDE